MRKHLRAAMMVGLMASGSAWASPDDREEDSDATELPVPVAQGLRAAAPRGQILESERRGALWEATVRVGLRTERLRLDAQGRLLDRVVPVSPRELPDTVLATLDRVHPRSTIWRASRIESGEGALHEVLLARGDRRTAIVVDEQGRIVREVSRT